METRENPEGLVLPEPSHVGYVTRDFERTVENLQKYWGFESVTRMVPDYFNKRYHGEPEDFKVQFAFARMGGIVYEVITILQGKTIYEDFMKDHGEGMHHLGYEISDLAKWTEAYEKAGIHAIMSAERKGLKWAYFDTPEIIVELLERTPEGKVV
jgi:catechol 2,3-dioxygenase-like lactoylglutathione lyase family enzyme